MFRPSTSTTLRKPAPKPSATWTERKSGGSGAEKAGWVERHFRPSPTWRRAGSAHDQLSLELPESGGENTVGGDRRLRRRWPVSAGLSGRLETGGAGEAQQRWFSPRVLGSGTPAAEVFVLREGAVPSSLSPTPFVGRTHSPPPGRARPRPPALPAAGRWAGDRRASGAPRVLPYPRGAARAGGGPGRASRVSARAPGLAPGRSSAAERLLVGGPAGRRRILRRGLGAWLLCGLDVSLCVQT